jgi:adenylate kinase family enzyme
MQRILVIGCCGSGKSTFSKQLSHKLDLPLVQLDRLFWLPGWIEREYEEFENLMQSELEREVWIIDGNYLKSLPQRLEYADTVIFLDFNRWICTWRAIRRWLLQQGYQAEGCPQKVSLSFLKYILWDYRKRHRIRALEIKARLSPLVNWISFNNSSAALDWLSNL